MMTDLTPGTTYYVRIRTVSGSFYSAWSAVKTVKISATGMSDITVTASDDQTDFYVALPLEGSVSYTFSCTTNAGVEYRGTKTGNLTNGKYYTAAVDVAPGVGVTNTSAWGDTNSWDIGDIYF